jgi:hypothetical protein
MSVIAEGCLIPAIRVTSSCSHLHLAVTRAADITELNLPKRAAIAFVDGKDKLLHFQITMRPEEGIYRWRAMSPLHAVHASEARAGVLQSTIGGS